MECKNALLLLDTYITLTGELTEAMAALANMGGRKDPRYIQFKRSVKQLRLRVERAHTAYERHISEHGCLSEKPATQG
jgi:hypothetical protein